MHFKQSKFTLRVDSTLLKKFHYIADYNARSANREIEVLIKKHVKAFENTYGKIDLKWNSEKFYAVT